MKWPKPLSFLLIPALLAGCASHQVLPRTPAQVSVVTELKTPSRDDVYGPNQARLSVKGRAAREYIFRNVASAFPDTGKNMLLKDRALPKKVVQGALDHSPWRAKLYEDPVRIAENQARFSNANKSFYSTAINQREAAILAQSPKRTPNQPFYQTETFGQDDAFELNSTMESAFDLTNAENRWISLLGPNNTLTEGVQWDEDWYKITVASHYRRLMLDLRFQQYLGDIDMKLFDAKGNLIATSQGNGDDEFIHIILDKGGVYYVQIFGANRGNRYDLIYSTYSTDVGDDEFEDNDKLAQSFDLRGFEGQWLSEIRGEGVAADDDFYVIRVPTGRERVVVDFRVRVERGDVDVRLLNSQGKTIASSANVTDDDYIDFTVPSAGTYFLKVYPFAPQGSFNLYDLKWTTEKPSPRQGAGAKTTSRK